MLVCSSWSTCMYLDAIIKSVNTCLRVIQSSNLTCCSFSLASSARSLIFSRSSSASWIAWIRDREKQVIWSVRISWLSSPQQVLQFESGDTGVGGQDLPPCRIPPPPPILIVLGKAHDRAVERIGQFYERAVCPRVQCPLWTFCPRADCLKDIPY